MPEEHSFDCCAGIALAGKSRDELRSSFFLVLGEGISFIRKRLNWYSLSFQELSMCGFESAQHFSEGMR